MKFLILIGLMLLAVPATAAPSVTVIKDNIVCTDIRGHRQAVTSRGGYDSPVLSPNGHTLAFLHMDKSNDIPNGLAGALWVGDCLGHNARRLLPSAHRGQDGDNGWVSLDKPSFSLDGRDIYVSAFYGGDSGLVHRVDVATGSQVYVFPAELIGVIHAGPYRGDLLATQHTDLVDKQGAHYGGYPVYVFTPDGKAVLRVPHSEGWNEGQLKAWLKQMDWQVQ